MHDDDKRTNRKKRYERNALLEALLEDLNSDLAFSEQQAIKRYHGQLPEKPPVFIVGAPRCGSTLFMQWLALTGAFSYPTNLLSRFWNAPITGIRIQKLLTDPKYDFKEELYDFNSEFGFESDLGKTVGALAPNEFWYFWRRFFDEGGHQLCSDFEGSFDFGLLQAELAGITDLMQRPFAAKGMIFNENIPFMAKLFPNAVFIWLRRAPEFNIQSILQARERFFGDMSAWYSFHIKDYPVLKDLPPLESVTGQLVSLHQSIRDGLYELSQNRRLEVDYETFCERPPEIYKAIAGLLERQGEHIPDYCGPENFDNHNGWRLDWLTQAQARHCYQQLMREKG